MGESILTQRRFRNTDIINNGRIWAQSDSAYGGFSCTKNENALWIACSSHNNGIYYSDDGKH